MEIQRTKHTSASPQSKLIHFLNSEIRPESGFSVSEEYPSLFRDYPGGESLFVEDRGSIAAHVGILVREFHHPSFRMKVGLIGSVVTAKAWQNQGLASQLINRAVDELKRRGCQLCVLWTDSPEFYENFGFYRGGKEKDYKFSADSVPLVESGVVPCDISTHAHLIWRWYLKNEMRLDRSLEEQKKLCSIPQTKIFVTESDKGISSYLAIQKGADFTDYIHECGGEPHELQKNIAWVQKNIFPDHPLTLIAPYNADLGPIKSMVTESWDGVLGCLKLLETHNLMVLYMSYLKEKGVQHHWDRVERKFSFGGKTIPLESDRDFLKLIFGCDDPTYPPCLPFFLWGFDSI